VVREASSPEPSRAGGFVIFRNQATIGNNAAALNTGAALVENRAAHAPLHVGPPVDCLGLTKRWSL